MHDMILELVSFSISCIVTMYIIFGFSNKMYKPRLKKTYWYYLCYIVITITFIGINYLENSVINVIFFIFAVYFVASFLYNGSNKTAIVQNIALAILVLLFELVTVATASMLLKNTMNNAIQNINFVFILTLISKFGMLYIYDLAVRFFKKIEIGKTSIWQTVLLFMFLLFEIYVVISFYNVNLENQHSYNLIYISIGFLLLNIFILYLFEFASRNASLHNSINLLEQQSKMQHEFYSQLEIQNEKSQQILHDIKNHIIAMSTLSEEGERYRESVCDKIDSLSPRFYCDNKILKVIINEKIRIADSLGIVFNIQLEDVNFDFMEDIDVTTIFANILDNAIHAANKCDNTKFITIHIKMFHNMLVCKVENSYAELPVIKGGVFQSSKQGHKGIGIDNITNIVKKYDGDIKLKAKNNVFSTCFNIPILEK